MMRIWDLNPGYLNRQSLLGEHRELHGIASIIANGKKGYSKHPETLRWVGYEWALYIRHAQLAAEMALRGFNEKSPLPYQISDDSWPNLYIDEPADQFSILAEKYKEKEQGRIPLTRSAQELWAHHKYSVMARDIKLYKRIGRELASPCGEECFSKLATTLTECIRKRPSIKGIKNALQHMWGYVSDYSSIPGAELENLDLLDFLIEIQELTKREGVLYLSESTALGELMVWILEDKMNLDR